MDNKEVINDYDLHPRIAATTAGMVDKDFIQQHMIQPYERGYEYPEIEEYKQTYHVTVQNLQDYTEMLEKATDKYVDSQIEYIDGKTDRRMDGLDSKLERIRDVIYDNRIMFIIGILITFAVSITIMAVIFEYEVKPEIVEEVRQEMLEEYYITEARYEEAE